MTTQTHAPNHTVSAPVALAIVATIVLLGALAFWAALRTDKPTPAAPAPTALEALSHVARTDAQQRVTQQLALVDTLAAQATADPALLHDQAWREAWMAAWSSISRGSTGTMHAAAAQCWAAIYIGTMLDIPACVRDARQAMQWEVGK